MGNWKLIVGGMLTVGLLIQLIPVRRTNPPITGALETPADVRIILKRACYDCHSHETRWPWYSHVAPVSWLIAHDVKEGRKQLNFSAWTGYTDSGRDFLREKIVKEASSGDMPPAPYAWMHSSTALSTEDLKRLTDWEKAERTR